MRVTSNPIQYMFRDNGAARQVVPLTERAASGNSFSAEEQSIQQFDSRA